ncbi:hypothetical protein [Hymenopteran arli-related virus OKIAV98]|uniref:Uncharacterized protein n=1 Tax=Hymenopteran arli-related virus OKIAV98 TaxID=2792565 RepID=A0AAE7P6B3_9MONO|nr:hypothetical protein QKS99_gp3 [Hymenopteran arli-related virus OKIAV98]QPL15293.1 hypothetical protein [Hymenopteran arli-related virus OKIAV98]
MAIQNVGIRYTIKDTKKGWIYTGVYLLGYTEPSVMDTETELKRKVLNTITGKRLLFTHKLYLILNFSSLKSVGVIPYDQEMKKHNGSGYKLDVGKHLGISHYAIAGSPYILESLDIVTSDKDNLKELTI